MENSELIGRWPGGSEPYLEKIPLQSLELGRFLDFVKLLPVKHKLLLLDSSVSGFTTYSRGVTNKSAADTDKELLQWTREKATQERTGGRSNPIALEVTDKGAVDIADKLFQWTCEPVTQIITAGRSGQTAFEKEAYQHGIFTWYLLKGLQGHADPRGDGVISFLDLAAYIGDHVSREKDVKQDPQFGTYEGEGQFFFLYRKKTDKGHQLEVELRKAVKNGLYSDGKNYLQETIRVSPGKEDRLKKEFGYIYDFEKPTEDERNWIDQEEKIEWRSSVWQVLSQRNHFF
jgi:hypothetical protein